MRVDRDLHVKLFYKGSLLPLPQWFCHGRDCRFTRKIMMQNFPNYIKLEGEQTFNILEELKELKFKKKENILVQCSFTLYFLTNIPTIYERVSISLMSLLRKITEGQLDAVKCAKSLKSQGVISEDVVLMLDEMYLQKCEE